jgi:4-deoxy-L-threo-5-hexosulose-uronate ketol-isomerase
MVVGRRISRQGPPSSWRTTARPGRPFFLEQRELGAINIGGPGAVHVDGKTFKADRLDCVYAPAGSRSVVIREPRSQGTPTKFYILSCVAHASHPAALMRVGGGVPRGPRLDGDRQQAPDLQVHPRKGHPELPARDGPHHRSTRAASGTPSRRTPITAAPRSTCTSTSATASSRTSWGSPAATRHLFLHNEQVALSPSWSIHCGCGFGSYSFIWGMAGENKVFDDMDAGEAPRPPLALPVEASRARTPLPRTWPSIAFSTSARVASASQVQLDVEGVELPGVMVVGPCRPGARPQVADRAMRMFLAWIVPSGSAASAGTCSRRASGRSREC